MFIAHLPAGYLLSRSLLACLPLEQRVPLARRKLLAAGLIGSVLPDIDLIYFYLLADRLVGHHVYWTMLLEIAITTCAGWVALRRPANQAASLGVIRLAPFSLRTPRS